MQSSASILVICFFQQFHRAIAFKNVYLMIGDLFFSTLAQWQWHLECA